MRRTTWAIVAWTAVWMGLYGVWALNPDPTELHGGLTTGVQQAVRLKPHDWQLFDYWLIGFVVLAAIWLLTRWWTRGRGKS